MVWKPFDGPTTPLMNQQIGFDRIIFQVFQINLFQSDHRQGLCNLNPLKNSSKDSIQSVELRIREPRQQFHCLLSLVHTIDNKDCPDLIVPSLQHQASQPQRLFSSHRFL